MRGIKSDLLPGCMSAAAMTSENKTVRAPSWDRDPDTESHQTVRWKPSSHQTVTAARVWYPPTASPRHPAVIKTA